MNNKFPCEIKLNDTWFEWEYDKFKETLDRYNFERRKLENIEHEVTKPIPCKSWTKDYYYGDKPCNMAPLWVQITQYISEQSQKEGWTYSHVETEQVDVNTDPYDDCEYLTDHYTVYAVVENEEDFRCSESYLTQEKYVQQLYGEVLELKERIDKKLKLDK